MYQPNNFLKKGIIVLITAMLLTMSNIGIYSSFGSYQTDSSAIEANNYYLNATTERTFYLQAVLSGITTLYALYVASVFLTKVALAVATPVLTTNSIEESYAKYDFSQFDN